MMPVGCSVVGMAASHCTAPHWTPRSVPSAAGGPHRAAAAMHGGAAFALHGLQMSLPLHM